MVLPLTGLLLQGGGALDPATTTLIKLEIGSAPEGGIFMAQFFGRGVHFGRGG